MFGEHLAPHTVVQLGIDGDELGFPAPRPGQEMRVVSVTCDLTLQGARQAETLFVARCTQRTQKLLDCTRLHEGILVQIHAQEHRHRDRQPVVRRAGGVVGVVDNDALTKIALGHNTLGDRAVLVLHLHGFGHGAEFLVVEQHDKQCEGHEQVQRNTDLLGPVPALGTGTAVTPGQDDDAGQEQYQRQPDQINQVRRELHPVLEKGDKLHQAPATDEVGRQVLRDASRAYFFEQVHRLLLLETVVHDT